MILSFFSWFFMLLLATIFFQINVDLAFGHCQSDQQELLLQLKNRLRFNPDVSLKLVKWNQSLDCCMWEGVTCDVRGRVTDLDLSNEWISDGIDNSSSLFNLQHLQSLNLANNNFGSILPSEFDKLSNLRHLNLSNAHFTGQIPLEISRLTSLVTLDLSADADFRLGLKLENPDLVILVEHLKELKHLYLDAVNISAPGKEWCQALSSLANLKVLSMSNCHLSSSIDSSLSKLQSLSVIRLDGNNLSGPFPEKIFQVRTLKSLDLSGNLLLEGSLKEFLPTSSLETLLLSGTRFEGTLPESIGNLGRLSRIGLAGCHFNGTIPQAMANLTQLVLLDFSSNNFSGPIPSFSLAKNPTHLNLAHNQLTGSILSTEWSSLSKLVSIDLSNNSLNGVLPASLFSIPSLQSIVLSQNQFTDRLNDSPKLPFSMLHSLQLDSNFSINATVSNPDTFPQINILKLASCKLTRFPNFLKEQSKLTVLDLSHNQVDGDIPNWVWNITSLKYLNISHNSLVNLQEPMQAPNSNLCFLDLHGNKLQGEVPRLSATYVDYSSNNFSSTLPIDIGDFLKDVFIFSISNNNLHGSIHESICNSTFLGVLDLSNNSLNGTIPQCLIGMKDLWVLDLSRNNLSGNIPDTFSSDCQIQTLDLNGNHIEGKIPRSLANCRELQVLDIGNNQINDTFPCHLKNISNLQVLLLSSNNFHGLIGCPNDNFSWPTLQIIDLASNHFKGELPHQWFQTWKAMMVESVKPKVLVSEVFVESWFYEGNLFKVELHYPNSITITNKGFKMRLVKILSIFTFIDFSYNKLEGQIPEVLGEFRALIGLNLSYNAFTGQIPSSLGNLKLLESLDLSNNNLSGEIPQQLGDLDFLGVMNLSHNQLQGRIPSGRHIQTFPEDSFKDNKGLFGLPLKENCSANRVPTSEDKHSDNVTHTNWNFLSDELGFIFGLGIVILPLMLCKRWRVWYYKCIDGLLSKFFP